MLRIYFLNNSEIRISKPETNLAKESKSANPKHQTGISSLRIFSYFDHSILFRISDFVLRILSVSDVVPANSKALPRREHSARRADRGARGRVSCTPPG